MKQAGKKELIKKLTDKFSELTQKAIIHCPMVNGAQAFLDVCINKASLFLISATPQEELNIILKERSLNRYFQKIYGSPINKVEVLKKIMTFEKVSKNEMLYIGDSPEDQNAALMLGIHFIGRKSDRQLDEFGDICLDFVEINEHITHGYGFR